MAVLTRNMASIERLHPREIREMAPSLYQMDATKAAPFIEPFEDLLTSGHWLYCVVWPEGLPGIRAEKRGAWRMPKGALKSCRDRGHRPQPFGYVNRYADGVTVSYPEMAVTITMPRGEEDPDMLSDREWAYYGIWLMFQAEDEGVLDGATNNPT